MHPLSKTLESALAEGRRYIGQLVLFADLRGHAFAICHLDDETRVEQGDWEALERFNQPRLAREWSLYSDEGDYRFTKGQANLKAGFLFLLDDLDGLRMTLEHFYPAQLALWVAGNEGKLRTQNLYEKLERQTGMYRFARNISKPGAQELVKEICGPGNQCLKKILWQLDAETPLEDSEASQFNGVLEGVEPSSAIPLQCQEACNFFVAQCRKRSREEFEAQQGTEG